MRGEKVDRGKNPNSFYMTDEDLYSSNINVYVDNKIIFSSILEDNPADSRGSLSWHYQPVDTLLDEAGSYGYVCKVKINKLEYDLLPDIFSEQIESDNGLSLFDRKSGKYPIGIELFFNAF